MCRKVKNVGIRTSPFRFRSCFFFFTVPNMYVLKPVPALLNKESSSHEVVLVVLWSNNSLIRTPFFPHEK